MGGRGSESKLSPLKQAVKAAQEYRENQRREMEEQRNQKAETAVKTSRSQQAVIDYVNEQMNVDLNKYRDSFTERFEGNNAVLVYWKDVPSTDKQKIERLKTKGRLSMEDFGAWGKVITLRRK